MYNDIFFPKQASWEKNLQNNEVWPKWNETINDLKRHIYRKREQVASCNKNVKQLNILGYNKKEDLRP